MTAAGEQRHCRTAAVLRQAVIEALRDRLDPDRHLGVFGAMGSRPVGRGFTLAGV
jgi:hypothetical protein